MRRLLPEIGQKHSCCFLLAPEIDGWIGIYPSGNGQDAEVSAEIAGRLKTEVLHVILHDDDLFNYTYHFDGHLVDEFSSKPDYFGEVTETRRKNLAGNPEELRGLLRNPKHLDRLRKLLSSASATRWDKVPQLLARFAALLGLPNCSTCYEYVMYPDEDDDIGRRTEFEHVPDQAPEKARRRAVKAASASQLDALREKGLVLFEQSPAELSVFAPDSSGQGFLAFSDHFTGFGSQEDRFAAFIAARESRCALRRLADPWGAAPPPIGIETKPGVRQARISPSGRYLAVGFARETELWDVAAKRRLCEMPQPNSVAIAGFTADETALITVGGTKIDWNSIPDGQLVHSVPVKVFDPVCGFHPSGSILVALEDRVTLAIIELPEGNVRKRFVLDSPEDLDLMPQWLAEAIREGDPRMIAPGETNVFTTDFPQRLLFDSEGRRLFCATDKGAWGFDWEKLLDTPDGQAEPQYRFRSAKAAPGPLTFLPFRQPASGVLDLTYDPETGRPLLGLSDGTVRLMDLATGSTTTLLTIPDAGPIYRLMLSADGAALCTQEVGTINAIQNQFQALFAPNPLADSIPNERPGRLFIWDYRKLLAGMGQ